MQQQWSLVKKKTQNNCNFHIWFLLQNNTEILKNEFKGQGKQIPDKTNLCIKYWRQAKYEITKEEKGNLIVGKMFNSRWFLGKKIPWIIKDWEEYKKKCQSLLGQRTKKERIAIFRAANFFWANIKHTCTKVFWGQRMARNITTFPTPTHNIKAHLYVCIEFYK